MRTSLKISVTITHTGDKCGARDSGGQRHACQWEHEGLYACRLFHTSLDMNRHRADACMQAENSGEKKDGEGGNLLSTLIDWSNEK